jgi:hypothetical protein
MANVPRRLAITGCALAALALAGCRRTPQSWIPVLEQTSTAFLETETEAVASRVRSAAAHLPAEPESAAADLAAAEQKLDHLLTYYLPLLEAREHSYNAYRHFYLGKTAETERELEEVEKILMETGAAGQGRLLTEMKDPLEHLEDARVALQTDGGETAKALQALATRLNFLLLKGGLVLAE